VTMASLVLSMIARLHAAARCPGRRARGDRGERKIGHEGRSVPACSATMYEAYQAGQLWSCVDR
jgi:hypothetical protein